MLFENYRELVTEKAAKEYFGILPEIKGDKGSKSKSKGARKTTAKVPAKRSKLITGKSTK
jgi:hypothetical protein